MSDHERDLVERTYIFARDVRRVVPKIPQTIASIEDSKQLIRSSGSVAANYLESQEGLSRKDFFYRIKICRKEARESNLWLRLLMDGDVADNETTFIRLADEADQLKKIFSSIAGSEGK